MSDYLTTSGAALILGVTRARVLALIRAGRIPTTRFGQSHMINRKDLEAVKVRMPGRPRLGRAIAAPT